MTSKKLMEIWKEYQICPDISLLYLSKRKENYDDAKIFLRLAVENNRLRQYSNIEEVVSQIEKILQ